jgi:hypothetical protein
MNTPRVSSGHALALGPPTGKECRIMMRRRERQSAEIPLDFALDAQIENTREAGSAPNEDTSPKTGARA